jgi:hypothetical protein
MNAVELLEKYSDIVLRRADLDTKKQAIVDTVLTPEIKQQLADIDAEFAPAFQALSEEFAQVEAELKTAVIEAGQTVRGTTHMAVFGKPRISWDTRMLDGLATVFPQLNEARSYGAASVSIRLIK